MPAADRASGGPLRQTSRRGALGGARSITALLVTLAIVAASVVKGAIAFGFPIVATPLLALVVDVKTAIAVSIVPNITMDAIQAVRRRGLFLALRRHALLLLLGIVGMVVGTRLLAVMPARLALVTLSAFLLAFVALTASGVRPHVPRTWEWWLSPLVGFGCGVLGGLTNVPGTPLVLYFYALNLDKHEFVQAVALAFVTYKVVQLVAAAWYGLLTWPVLVASLALTVVGLSGFAVGLWLQDTLPERTFQRLVLVLLVVSALILLARAVRG